MFQYKIVTAIKAEFILRLMPIFQRSDVHWFYFYTFFQVLIYRFSKGNETFEIIIDTF